MTACLQFLDCDETFRTFWPWADLMRAPTTASNSCLSDREKWLLGECAGRLCLLPEIQRKSLFEKQTNSTTSYDLIAGNYLATLAALKARPPQIRSKVRGVKDRPSAFSHSLPLFSNDDEPVVGQPSAFVSLPSLVVEFRNVSKAIFEAKPVLIQGPMGCGKTRLVEHLAKRTDREEFVNFHRIQMSDQTDARSLVGGYSCRDVPGQFQWEDGVLTTAVKNGHWLLVEDVDLAPADVLATLIPLIELRQLHVPSRGVILNATPEFQLFMTQRTGGSKSATSVGKSFDLKKSAVVITIHPLDESELKLLLNRQVKHIRHNKSLFEFFSREGKTVNLGF